MRVLSNPKEELSWESDGSASSYPNFSPDFSPIFHDAVIVPRQTEHFPIENQSIGIRCTGARGLGINELVVKVKKAVKTPLIALGVIGIAIALAFPSVQKV